MCERNALTTVSFSFIVKLYYASFISKWMKMFLFCFVFVFCFEVFDVFFFGGWFIYKTWRKVTQYQYQSLLFTLLKLRFIFTHFHQNHTIYRDLKPEKNIINAWWWRWNHIKHSLTDFCLSKRYSLEDEEIKNNKSYGYWSWLLVSCHSCLWNGLQVRRESFLVFVDSNLVSLIKGLLNKRSKRNILI